MPGHAHATPWWFICRAGRRCTRIDVAEGASDEPNCPMVNTASQPPSQGFDRSGERTAHSDYRSKTASILAPRLDRSRVLHGAPIMIHPPPKPTNETADALTTAGPTKCHRYPSQFRPSSIHASIWERSQVKNDGDPLTERGCIHGIRCTERLRPSTNVVNTWGLSMQSLESSKKIL